MRSSTPTIVLKAELTSRFAENFLSIVALGPGLLVLLSVGVGDVRQRVSIVRRITRPVPLRKNACSGPRFANRSPVTPISGAACVELSTPRGGSRFGRAGNADASACGQPRNARSRRRSAHLRRVRSSARRVSAVSREKKRADAVRVRLRDCHPRAWAVRPDLARVAHPFRWMSNPRVARTPRQAARGRWDSRRISAADLSAGFKEVVDARGCGARCTRRARQPCAAPVSVTGLEGKRESGPSSENVTNLMMIIRRSEPGAWDLGMIVCVPHCSKPLFRVWARRDAQSLMFKR